MMFVHGEKRSIVMPSTKKSQVKSVKKSSASVKKNSGSASKKRTSIADSKPQTHLPVTSLDIELQAGLLSLLFQVQDLYAHCSKLRGQSAQKKCRADANQQVMKHFVQLVDESKILQTLKHKEKTGTVLSDTERFTLQALHYKNRAIKAAAAELEEAESTLTSTVQHQLKQKKCKVTSQSRSSS
jgi:hypothetical protein